MRQRECEAGYVRNWLRLMQLLSIEKSVEMTETFRKIKEAPDKEAASLFLKEVLSW